MLLQRKGRVKAKCTIRRQLVLSWRIEVYTVRVARIDYVEQNTSSDNYFLSVLNVIQTDPLLLACKVSHKSGNSLYWVFCD